MSKRSVWADVSKEVRKYIIARDKQCIICGAKKPLTMAHIFLSRAKGGKGSKENIVALCNRCHYFELDNPLGRTKNENSKNIIEYCKKYLIEKEKIEYNKDFIESLKYKKQYEEIDINKILNRNRCKNCINVSKVKKRNTTIIEYVCMKQNRRTSKNNCCDKYISRF